MELKISTWSISMLVFPSEVALKLSLRLERRVGPIAEICEAVSPTFSSSYIRTKTGTANPNIPKGLEWYPKLKEQYYRYRIEKKKKHKKNDWEMNVIPLKDSNVNEMSQK